MISCSFFTNEVNFCAFIVQAAAHGLPIVATKNGGPVDIHQVCLLIGRKELIKVSTLLYIELLSEFQN